jgi:hypothetical protein
MDAYFSYYLTGIIMIPVFIFALICQARVKSAYRKYSRINNSRGLTGAETAYELLRLNGINDVTIQRTSGNLTDNYNPSTKIISLSEGVYSSTSVAAVGIACHEAGHACQHAQEYAPLKFRNFIIPATRLGSYLGIPLALVGMFLNTDLLIYIGIILYGIVAFFQFITLPVEFDASRRALSTIEDNGFLVGEEYKGAKSVLTAAALTYVAALVSALATLLRLYLIMNRGRRR